MSFLKLANSVKLCIESCDMGESNETSDDSEVTNDHYEINVFAEKGCKVLW